MKPRGLGKMASEAYMLEKLLRSPLVAFALFTIFASSAEYAGWSNMANVKRAPDQQLVIAFLVGFPLLVTVLFFLTLWLRPRAFLGTADSGPMAART